MSSSDSKVRSGAWAGGLAQSSNQGVAAAGTTQATAAAITADLTVFSTVAASAGAILPAPSAAGADDFFVVNAGANALAVYPPVGHKINAGATNAAVSVPVGKSAHLVYAGGVQWIAVVSA